MVGSSGKLVGANLKPWSQHRRKDSPRIYVTSKPPTWDQRKNKSDALNRIDTKEANNCLGVWPAMSNEPT